MMPANITKVYHNVPVIGGPLDGKFRYAHPDEPDCFSFGEKYETVDLATLGVGSLEQVCSAVSPVHTYALRYTTVNGRENALAWVYVQ